MTRRTYSDEVKAAAMAALLEGQSVSAVAKEYEIPKGTVSDWKKAAIRGVGSKPTQKKDSEAPAGNIGDLLLELLEKNVRSLIAISEVVSNAEWLRKQSAAEIATLFGVKHDKAVRMIEALNRSDESAES